MTADKVVWQVWKVCYETSPLVWLVDRKHPENEVLRFLQCMRFLAQGSFSGFPHFQPPNTVFTAAQTLPTISHQHCVYSGPHPAHHQPPTLCLQRPTPCLISYHHSIRVHWWYRKNIIHAQVINSVQSTQGDCTLIRGVPTVVVISDFMFYILNDNTAELSFGFDDVDDIVLFLVYWVFFFFFTPQPICLRT